MCSLKKIIYGKVYKMESYVEGRDRYRVRIGKEKYRIFKNGYYKAKLLKVEEGEGKYEQPIFKLYFLVTAINEKRPRRIMGIINRNEDGKYGKLWQLRKAFEDVECEEGDEFSIGEYIGKECFIYVEQRRHANAITEYISLQDGERDFREIV